ncbi:hypothetical protein FXN61_39215 [Lentzea sp. PSKA42]|uniref:Secreted protein n=1 Tax=Lentzea indica TaxID=2604800 RepID=A0ABX1FTV6_9PSEU|nr:hypothetical protein [Lentzea indica]NKE62444.1 hypothetical protein [Lentzea indica]
MRKLMVGVSTTAALLLGVTATPAQAAENPLTTTGARGFVNSYNKRVEACDTRADGRRAMARAVNVTQGILVGWAEDKNGANGCTPQSGTGQGAAVDPFWHTPRRGDVIRLEVWIQDGAGGAQENLRRTEFTY